MLREQDVEKWANERGEHLHYRVRLEGDLPFVLRDGILPRRWTGQPRGHPGLTSSSEHVYLLTDIKPETMTAAGSYATAEWHFRVSIRALNRWLFDPDEDCITAHRRNPAGWPPASHDAVSHLPYYDNLSPWPQSDEEVIPWMEHNAMILGRPEWILHSMQHGRVAYRGVVRPELLTPSPWVSEHVRKPPDDIRWAPWSAGDPPSPWIS